MEMPTTSDRLVLVAQRDVLERLLDLTAQQEAALNQGDMLMLTHLSEQRTREVQQNAAVLPPQTAWSAELEELALHVKERSDDLQHALRACMAAVRRELVALTDQSQVGSYLTGVTARRGATWQA